ncbi:MAG: hypothetical protein EBR02_00075 [Alphaproteobacteria bacterium]|nr:hypothetical protein [Alphaproteobacteria bacterium]
MSHLSAKKKALQKKNRFHQEIYQAMRLRRAEDARTKEINEPEKSRSSESKKDTVWSEKTAQIRNRLTGKKRDSKERWNRFAGTGGEGGRGL